MYERDVTRFQKSLMIYQQERQTLLYVEGGTDIQEIAVLALAHLGRFLRVVASSRPEALGLAPECRPDLILLNVMMPGMDGLAILRALRADADTESVPVIFMTAKFRSARSSLISGQRGRSA